MKHPKKTLIVLGALFCVAGCDEKKPPNTPAPPTVASSVKPTPPAAPVAEKSAAPQTVLVLERAGAANESLQKEREQLETQRRELTAKLEQEAASGSIWTVIGIIAAIGLPLLFCWWFVACTASDPHEEAVGELLIDEMLSDRPPAFDDRSGNSGRPPRRNRGTWRR